MQEMPRRESGWNKPQQCGTMQLHWYQGLDVWRGVAIAVDSRRCIVKKRKGSEHGMWLLLQIKGSSRCVWVGSCYLSTGVSQDVYELQQAALLKALPPSPWPVLAGGDWNTSFGWIESSEGNIAAASSAKLRSLKSSLIRRRLQVIPQSDVHAYTHWSRKNNGTGGQIDAWWCNFPGRCGNAIVHKDSRLIVGTDHEQVSLNFTIAFPRCCNHKGTGSKQLVVDDFVVPSPITQRALEDLASVTTGPRTFHKQPLPQHIQQLKRQAKQSRSPGAWKLYMSSLREHRQQKREQDIERASLDWSMYRRLKREGASAWQAEYGLDSEGEPLEGIKHHFQARFDRRPAWDAELDSAIRVFLSQNPDMQPLDFSEQEVYESVMKGGNRRAVGVDAVPQELLKAIIQKDEGLTELTAFYSSIFRARCTPPAWNTSLMSLLAKIAKPLLPKDLRPIMMSSHVYKSYSRLVLTRVRQYLAPSGPEQCAAPNRQTTDMLFSLSTVCQLSLEWGAPLALVRMDISKAFDSIDRVALANTILQEIGPYCPYESIVLVDMLRSGNTLLDTSWGWCELRNGVGVKQGSVESPAVFSWLMDLIMSYVRASAQSEPQWMEGLDLDHVVFMDDVVGWAKSTKSLQNQVGALLAVLKKWGLMLNVEKCALICHGDVGLKQITVEGITLKALPAGSPLSIMGTPIGPTVTPTDILESFMERARRCFRAKYNILHSSASLKHRMLVLDRVVLTTMTWAFGILHPTKEITTALNQLQQEMVISMAGWKRKGDEGYVDYKQRSFRLARACIHQSEETGGAQFRFVSPGGT